VQSIPKFFPTLCLGLALFFSSLSANAGPPKGWTFVDFESGLKQAAADGRRVFVYFGRAGCPTCARVNEESFSNKELKAKLASTYVLAYVDTESGKRLRLPTGERLTEMDLGLRYRVSGTPYFFFLEPGGEKIISVPGYVTAKQFFGLDLFVEKEIYKRQSLEEFLSGKS